MWMWRSVPWTAGQGTTGGHVIDIGGVDVFLGLDVGKGEHHATALSACFSSRVRSDFTALA